MRRRDRVTLTLGAIALAVSVLALGSATRWAQASVAGVVALGVCSQLTSRRSLDAVPPLLVLIGAAFVLTAIQLIPLPDSVLDVLNPTGNGLRAEGAAIAGTSPWPSLSLDPPATIRALAYFAILFATAAVGLRVAASERGRFWILSAVALACGAAAAVTGVHTLLQLHAVYGVYEPLHATPPVLGPLLNPNHLGCLMAVGAVLSLGLVFYQRQPVQLRVLWIVNLIGCITVGLASLSRGAAIALVLGSLVTLAVLVGNRLAAHADRETRRQAFVIKDVPLTIVVALGLALALYASGGRVADQIENTSLTELNEPVSKFAAWTSSFELLKESPWFGIGRGATESTLTRVHSASAYVTFSHLENEYVQAIVEWGVPGAIILALLTAWVIVTAIRRWRDGPLAAAALGALAAVAFQSSVDFGVELLGIAMPATLVATTLATVPVRDRGRVTLVRARRLALVTVLVITAVMLLSPMTRTLQEDHDALTAQKEPIVEDAHDLIERHPLDYFGYGEVAALMMLTGDPLAARYLNHAMALHPFHPGLHRLAARLLIGAGRTKQAAIEYSLALHGTLAPRLALSEITSVLPAAEDAAAAIPIDYPNSLLVLHALHELHRDDVAEAWLVRVVEQPNADVTSIDQLYDLATLRKDFAVAEQAARARLAAAKTTTARVMLAKAQLARNEVDEILEDLADVESWQGRTDEKGEAWLILCDARIALRQWDPALSCLHRLDASGINAGAHDDIAKRLRSIEKTRESDARKAAIEALERRYGSGAAPPIEAPR